MLAVGFTDAMAVTEGTLTFSAFVYSFVLDAMLQGEVGCHGQPSMVFAFQA